MQKKHCNSTSLYIALCACLFLAQCSLKRPAIKKKVIVSKCKSLQDPLIARPNGSIPPPITIWIHGTRFNRNPLFHTYFNANPGLKLVTELDPSHYLFTAAKTLSQHSTSQFPTETFYIYGWSGKLNCEERRINATILFHELHRISDEFTKMYGTQPSIQIISHSHGGNIALNLATICKQSDRPLHIDKLILMACPVQAKTQECIKDPLFRRVYSLYSSLDFMQILAPQMIYKVSQTKKGHYKAVWNFPPFSDRRFPHHPNLAQVKIKLDGRAIMHGEFTLPKFLSALHEILTNIDTWYFEQNNVPTWIEKEKLLCVYTNGRQQQLA